MTDEHVCTVCFQVVSRHRDDHFPPLCCPGCDCGSYEDEHASTPEEPTPGAA